MEMYVVPIAILLGAYLLPAIIATDRKHSKATAIWVLTILLGWTFFGWAIALVWACTENNKPVRQPSNVNNPK